LAEPFLSEIRIMSFNFPPKGWAFCNGQLLPINQNQALFFLGTTFGGTGGRRSPSPTLVGWTPIQVSAGRLVG
jgi:microcystin-dependent protein